MTEPIEKPGPGGRRPGAGRPKGARGKATIERENRARALLAEAVEKLDLDAKPLQPLDTMLLVMVAAVKAGDLPLALSASRDAAPYVHHRMTEGMAKPIPADLLPDPAPVPDEPGPVHPIH